MGAERPPDPHGRLLALRDDRLGFLIVDRRARREIRLLAHDDSVRRRGRLQARSRVDHVAGDDAFALSCVRCERDERLARVDGDPHLQVELGRGRIQLRDRVEDRQRGADGPLGIVAVSDRGAENGHDGIADVLLDRAAEGFDCSADPGEVGRLDRADVLGIEPLGSGGEPDQVDEEDRHDLSLLGQRACGLGQGRAAAIAEPRPGRVFSATFRTGLHGQSVRRRRRMH